VIISAVGQTAHYTHIRQHISPYGIFMSFYIFISKIQDNVHSNKKNSSMVSSCVTR